MAAPLGEDIKEEVACCSTVLAKNIANSAREKPADIKEDENGVSPDTKPKNIESPNPGPDTADKTVLKELDKSVTSYPDANKIECCPIPNDTKCVLN